MKQGILEFWVGLFVLLGALALGVLAFRVAGGSQLAGGAATYTVYADFESAVARENRRRAGGTGERDTA